MAWGVAAEREVGATNAGVLQFSPHQNALTSCRQAELEANKNPHCSHWHTAGRQEKKNVLSPSYTLGLTGGTQPCEGAGLQGQFTRQGSGDSRVFLFNLSPAGGTKLLRNIMFSPQVTYTEGISTDQGGMIPQPIFLCQLYCLFLTASCH